MEFEDSTCRSVQREVLEKETKAEKSCGFKTKELCMFAGASQGEEQALKFVEGEKLNLESVQINAEIAKSQEELKTRESNEDIQQNIETKREGPSDDWSKARRGIKACVRFPKSTPIEFV